MRKWKTKFLILLLTVTLADSVFTMLDAQLPLPRVTVGVEESGDPEEMVLSMKIVLLLTILTLSPSILIMMTSFTRVIIVFQFLRSALGTNQIPSGQILIGLALFVTYFIMRPVFNEINETALQPYLEQTITQTEALENAVNPLRTFMLKQTREKDLELFVQLQSSERPNSKEDLSLAVIIPAFIISEINTAFRIGFLLYLPMLLIDIIVASVLLSMGMMMLPPIMISLPFKLLLFVLVDGWYLVIESVVKGFG